jgi:proliferating cell nuclear antigen PCNA
MNIAITNLQKAETFAAIFQHIKVFTENVNIMFEAERMYIQAMDTSRVSIFEITLPSAWFDKYEQTNATNVTIGVNTTILFKILNTRDKMQEITMDFSDDNTDKLFIHFTGENKEEFDKHFEVALMDIESEIMQIPDIDYQAEFAIGSTIFANIVNQLKLFGDSLDIKCTEEKIELCSNNGDQGKMSVEIKMDDLTSFEIDEGRDLQLSFSLTFMHNICLYNKITKEIEVKISSDYPLKIVYKLPGHDDAKMFFFLAPKISED